MSKRILLRASSGDSKLTASIFTSAKYFSPSCGRPHLAADGPPASVELADLRRRNVNVIRTGKVVVIGEAQEAIRQDFQHALSEYMAFFLLLGLDLK